MIKNIRNIALIPAAGIGTRFSLEQPKQYIEINQLPILLHTLQRLSISEIDAIYVLLAPTDIYFQDIKQKFQDFFSGLLHQENSDRYSLSILYVGGESRANTVLNALNYLMNHQIAQDDDWILVHDSVRCTLPLEYLCRLMEQVILTGRGGILAKKIVDTVKEVNVDHTIKKTIDRGPLWLAQTPQMFLFKDLIAAYHQVIDMDQITDEASLFDSLAKQPLVIASDDRNFKITTVEDMHYASFLLTNIENKRV